MKYIQKVAVWGISAVMGISVSALPFVPVTAHAPNPDKPYISVESVLPDRASLTLGKGQQDTLTAQISPDNASQKSLAWSTDNTDTVTVDANGTVTAKAVGTAVVTAKTPDGHKGTCTITVNNAPDSVALDRHEMVMGIGESESLSCTLPQNTTSPVIFSSSNRAVAVCDENGTVTAKRAGETVITVRTFNGKTDTCKVTVKNAPEKVTLNVHALCFGAGETYKLKAVLPDNTASPVAYQSGDDTIAVCDSQGNLTAKQAGEVIITVRTFNGKTDTCKVTVKNAPDYVSLEQSDAVLYVDDTFQLTVRLPQDTHSSVLRYHSSDGKVVTVDKNGLVTAKGAGEATVTVETYNGKSVQASFYIMALTQVHEGSSDDDILNSVRLHPVKTNSYLLDEAIDNIFGSILNSHQSSAEKLRQCFDYLATNISYAYISYDYAALDRNYVSGYDENIVVSAYSTLMTKRGNCYDYACTLAAVMQRLGYDAHVVHGLVGMQAGGFGNHYWVDATISGSHYIFDAQVENDNLGWGGVVNHYYYCLPPQSTSMYQYQEVWSTENFKVY